jgi:hypothetical protein
LRKKNKKNKFDFSNELSSVFICHGKPDFCVGGTTLFWPNCRGGLGTDGKKYAFLSKGDFFRASQSSASCFFGWNVGSVRRKYKLVGINRSLPTMTNSTLIDLAVSLLFD